MLAFVSSLRLFKCALHLTALGPLQFSLQPVLCPTFNLAFLATDAA